MTTTGSSDAVEKKPWINKRDILWYLVFFGFAINYMIRLNLNIAIVSMVRPRPKNNISLSSECIAEDVAHNLSFSHNSSILEHAGFDWNEYQQGLILGSFYWLHWITQMPGGILARSYGTKLVFGVSNLLGVLMCFVIPAASKLGYEYLIFVRILQGLITGFSWPAMHDMTAKWIPPNERSKFVTAYLGSSVGAGLTFPMCGYIISNWGWELVFHVCGVIGCMWYGAWYVLVFDSPAEHPRISKKEKEYIIKSLGRSISTEKSPTPWKSILTSGPVWLNVFAQWGGIWGLYTSITYAPTYFKMIHGWNIRATGFLSGLPHFLRVCWAFIFSQIGDYMLRNDKMKRTNVRKLATLFSCIIHGLCMWAMANSGCNYAAAIVFLTAATTSHGAVSTGSSNRIWLVVSFCVFDSPAEHPRISKKEKEYIIKSLGRSISTEKSPTPWKSILTSGPVWLNVFAQWGGIWGLYTSITYAPTYFKMIHGWNIRATGFLSGLPHFLRVCWAFIFSQIGDYMLRNDKMKRTNVRKLATLFSCIIHGLCMWAMANSGCNYAAAIVFLTAATTSHGAVSTGSLASFVDLSPNYASIQLGLSGMISVLPGFIAPVIVGYLTYNNQTIGQWQTVFEIAAVMLITPGILYLLFAKSDLQPWNSPQLNNEAILESELKVLKQDSEDLEKPITIKANK